MTNSEIDDLYLNSFGMKYDGVVSFDTLKGVSSYMEEALVKAGDNVYFFNKLMASGMVENAFTWIQEVYHENLHKEPENLLSVTILVWICCDALFHEFCLEKLDDLSIVDSIFKTTMEVKSTQLLTTLNNFLINLFVYKEKQGEYEYLDSFVETFSIMYINKVEQECLELNIKSEDSLYFLHSTFHVIHKMMQYDVTEEFILKVW